ncbi:glycosyltransferase family 2 protein [Paenibacillus alvei]|uniref:glycosyltransferase family 2 protein n=1 Tax=Paenibacillus alvei TaxID=44250 RepID=UPI0022823FBA|nr:glycosyltransferase family 2 protein [Paenibacillus alvei]
MGRKRDKVQILVSTYNGEKYLREQLDSLLNQTHSHFFITIRDDGSSDRTTTIVQNYVDANPNKIEAFYEQNVGVIASFFKLLLNYVHEDTDYICFCDQDDVWMSDKLERGIRSLGSHPFDVPLLYLTPTQMVDENLQLLNIWPPVPKQGPSFFNAIIENIAVGATIMLNRPAINLMISNVPSHESIVMHDWWAYIVVSAFGQVIYDGKPSIYYRQHQGNVVGGQKGFIDTLIRKWKNYSEHCKEKKYWTQAKEFERCWGEHLSTELGSELQRFLALDRGIVERTYYAMTTHLYRQSKLDNFVIRLMMIRGDILK